MKYTRSEQNKIRKLRERIADARAKLSGMKKRQKKAGARSAAKLRKFRATRRRIITSLRKQERSLERANKLAIQPVLREKSRALRTIGLALRRIYRVQYNARDVAMLAGQEKRRLALTAPQSKTELALVVKRLTDHGITIRDGKAIVFKRVSKDYWTRVGRYNATKYCIGSTVTVKDWNPRRNECGDGKLHACYCPRDCGHFVCTSPDDKFIAIEVNLKDFYAWPGSCVQNKIAFRTGTVLYRVDIHGRRIRA